jgi:hypothetical protein
MQNRQSSRLIQKNLTKVELFFELAGENKNRIVCVDEFVDKYSTLKLGNGGSWCRLDNNFGSKYKVCIIKKNKNIIYSWEPTIEEQEIIINEINNSSYIFGKGNTIFLIKVFGNKDGNSGRPIRKDIKNKLKNNSCVVCGSNSNIEIDHKNGLYNDPRVLNIKTQTIDDFQTLCKHCNDQKRQTYVWQEKNNKRYPTTLIPQFKIFNINYIYGDETYNKNDINAMVGTYWYDPIYFMQHIYLKKY